MKTKEEIKRRLNCFKAQFEVVAKLSDEYFELRAAIKELEWVLADEGVKI